MKLHFQYGPTISVLVIYSREMETHVNKKNLYINANNNLIHNSLKQEITQMSNNR